LTILLTVFIVRSTFGIIFGLLFGASMIFSGYVFGEVFNDILLKFIGLTSTCYAIIDIKEDLISRTVPGSDAYAMSEIIPLPPTVWGFIWICLAIWTTWWFLSASTE
jgi:hypothetical protein